MTSAAALRRDMQGWWDQVMSDKSRLQEFYSEFESEFWPLYFTVEDKTMVTIERLYDLWKATKYVNQAGIEGAFVECGVWCGGCMMLVALTLKELDDSRELYLFDGFEGMPKPGPYDADLHGHHASQQWHVGWAKATRDEVSLNMSSTGYRDEVILIEGPVEITLNHHLPNNIALARLDTDFYDSTKAELETIWPRLSSGGVLIVDDYGHWKGCRKAVDEFFASLPSIRPVRVDYSCITIQKP